MVVVDSEAGRHPSGPGEGDRRGKASWQSGNCDRMRVGLVGCTKSKLPHRSKAEQLYSPSAMFRGRRAYVQRSCDTWFVLSVAEHGLLSPTDELEPYDVTLTGCAVDRETAVVEPGPRGTPLGGRLINLGLPRSQCP